MEPEITLLALFVITTAVALLARRLSVPYTVALVVTGVLLGSLHAFRPPALTRELLCAIFLPGLVFEAAFHLDVRTVRQNKWSVLALAVPGVGATIAATAGLLVLLGPGTHLLRGVAPRSAVVFGALIAATDPIAVVAMFKSLGAPRRLGVLVEAESLLNDGTGVVLFTLVLAALGGAHFTAASAAMGFVRTVGLGALLGGAVGLAVARAIKAVDDPMIEITLTTIAAYGSFIAAEHFHGSGIIGTVVAGAVCGNDAARAGMGPSTRLAVETFWEYVAFALNSVIFLLVGFQADAGALLAAWKPIVAAYLATTLGRAVVVYFVTALLRPTRERIPWSWSAVLTWGGLRGALSMVLVLALPLAFPGRALLVTMTTGVVILSILLQGLTMPWVLRRLRVIERHPLRETASEIRGRIHVARAVLGGVEQICRDTGSAAGSLDELRASYEARLASAQSELKALQESASELAEADRRVAWRRALLAERGAALDAVRRGLLEGHAAERVLADIDARLMNALHPDGEHATEPTASHPTGGTR